MSFPSVLVPGLGTIAGDVLHGLADVIDAAEKDPAVALAVQDRKREARRLRHLERLAHAYIAAKRRDDPGAWTLLVALAEAAPALSGDLREQIRAAASAELGDAATPALEPVDLNDVPPALQQAIRALTRADWRDLRAAVDQVVRLLDDLDASLAVIEGGAPGVAVQAVLQHLDAWNWFLQGCALAAGVDERRLTPGAERVLAVHREMEAFLAEGP